MCAQHVLSYIYILYVCNCHKENTLKFKTIKFYFNSVKQGQTVHKRHQKQKERDGETQREGYRKRDTERIIQRERYREGNTEREIERDIQREKKKEGE